MIPSRQCPPARRDPGPESLARIICCSCVRHAVESPPVTSAIGAIKNLFSVTDMAAIIPSVVRSSDDSDSVPPRSSGALAWPLPSAAMPPAHRHDRRSHSNGGSGGIDVPGALDLRVPSPKPLVDDLASARPIIASPARGSGPYGPAA